jgi:hypothetical protein
MHFPCKVRGVLEGHKTLLHDKHSRSNSDCCSAWQSDRTRRCAGGADLSKQLVTISTHGCIQEGHCLLLLHHVRACAGPVGCMGAKQHAWQGQPLGRTSCAEG